MELEAKIPWLMAAALVLTSAAFAGPAKPVGQQAGEPTPTMSSLYPKARRVVGTIESLDASRLTLSCQVRGKKESMSFLLDPETQRQGQVAVGNEAVVRYRLENHQRIATFVKAHAPSSPASKVSLSKG